MHIQKQLENVLAENGVEEIMPAAGDEFDPMLHEAVEDGDKKQEISSKKEIENKIKKVLVRGYKMGDKVIRPSKVIVR
jgi:molecular chaperone GrpE